VAPWVAALRPKLDASFEPGTAIVRITAESTEPGAAAAAANAAAREAIARPVSSHMKLGFLAPSEIPRSPASPQRVPILLGSVVIGAILALFAAIAAGALRRRVQSSDEIQARFGLDVLSELPARRKLPSSVSSLFDGDRYSDVDEAFQRLRTTLEFAADGDLVIAVTSSAPGEGKSTIAAGLAWTLALVGHDVVAVDADLRRPTLHRQFNVRLEHGLADLDDRSMATAQALAQSTELSNLSVISAGRPDRHPTRVLHAILPRLLTELDGKVVVIDTPPLLGVSEAVMIANLAGNAILVVDARRRNPAELEQVMRDLTRGGARLLGAVVNRARLRHRGYAAAYATVNGDRAR
jgi:capsular exopolysaccharide synthesis family protein